MSLGEEKKKFMHKMLDLWKSARLQRSEPPLCVVSSYWELTMRQVLLCFAYIILFNSQYINAVHTFIGPILWSWNREITQEVDPRFEPRVPGPRTFNHYAYCPLFWPVGCWLLVPGLKGHRGFFLVKGKVCCFKRKNSVFILLGLPFI